MAPAIAQDPRTLRWWRDGEGAPCAAGAMRAARAWALGVAADVLVAAGEPDLAEPIRDRLGRVHRGAHKRDRVKLREALAPARPPRPRSRRHPASWHRRRQDADAMHIGARPIVAKPFARPADFIQPAALVLPQTA